MQVILLDDIQSLGHIGDEVRVKPGYARNYLYPQGKAVPATDEQRAIVAERKRELEKLAAQRRGAAEDRARALQDLRVEFSRLASDEGRLYGSVSAQDIAEAAGALGYELARSEIHLPDGPLKDLGEHEVSVSLHPEVHLTITVAVTSEGGADVTEEVMVEADADEAEEADEAEGPGEDGEDDDAAPAGA